MNDSLNITIELPQEFKDRRINPMFHTSLVRPYIKNDDILFPKRDTKVYYDFGNNEDQEWTNNELEGLDNYLEQRGAKAPQDMLQCEQAIY